MTNITNLKFKDEDGGDECTLLEVRIRPVDNGWILYIEDDIDDLEEVYTTKSELLERIKELL